MEKEFLRKYLSIAILIIVLFIAFLVIKPFILAIIAGFILAYLLKPVERKISGKLNKKLSAGLTVFIAFIIILLPITAIMAGIVTQTSQIIGSENFKSSIQKISNLPVIQSSNINFHELINSFLQFLASSITAITASLAKTIISIFITIISTYHILIGWDNLALKLKKYIPFKNKEKVSKEMSEITSSLIYGTLFIALAEFLVGSLGLWLADIKIFFLLSAIMAILAFIPGLGAGAVWIPALIYQLIQKQYLSAGIILITGLVISVYIDTFLRIKIAGKKTKIHPLIILIGIFGGVAVFGISGFIVGPLILSYAVKLLEEYWEN